MCKPVLAAAECAGDQRLTLVDSARGPKADPDRPNFVLELRPERSCREPACALRRALKILLRRCGLRAVSVEEHGALKRRRL